jgi:hypothetical protein
VIIYLCPRQNAHAQSASSVAINTDLTTLALNVLLPAGDAGWILAIRAANATSIRVGVFAEALAIGWPAIIMTVGKHTQTVQPVDDFLARWSEASTVTPCPMCIYSHCVLASSQVHPILGTKGPFQDPIFVEVMWMPCASWHLAAVLWNLLQETVDWLMATSTVTVLRVKTNHWLFLG